MIECNVMGHILGAVVSLSKHDQLCMCIEECNSDGGKNICA